MASKGRIGLRLGTQLLLLQLVFVTVTLIISFVLFAVFNRHRLDLQYHVHRKPHAGRRTRGRSDPERCVTR